MNENQRLRLQGSRIHWVGATDPELQGLSRVSGEALEAVEKPEGVKLVLVSLGSLTVEFRWVLDEHVRRGGRAGLGESERVSRKFEGAPRYIYDISYDISYDMITSPAWEVVFGHVQREAVCHAALERAHRHLWQPWPGWEGVLRSRPRAFGSEIL